MEPESPLIGGNSLASIHSESAPSSSLSAQGLWWFTVFTVGFCQVRNGERLKPTDSTCCRPLYDGKNEPRRVWRYGVGFVWMRLACRELHPARAAIVHYCDAGFLVKPQG